MRGAGSQGPGMRAATALRLASCGSRLASPQRLSLRGRAALRAAWLDPLRPSSYAGRVSAVAKRKTPGPIQDADLPGMFRHLRRLAARKDAPIVALIAVTTREPWKVLSSCILSLRTQDGTTAPAAMRMFARWPTVDAMAVADPGEVAKAIYPVGFYRTKAPQLVEMARRIRDEWGGRVPDEIDELLKLKGVGRKTANLVLILAFKSLQNICVDTHVHRISNRLGWVKTKLPDETEQALYRAVDAPWWPYVNLYLVTWGQNVCRPIGPRCGDCVIANTCPRIGVKPRS